MPDITMASVPSAGGATSASGFNGDVYNPAARVSLETINGWLDRDNREVSGSAWKVSWDKIRPHSMAKSESVGATNNLDYFPNLFPQDNTVEGAFLHIPGASSSVYVKRSGGTVLVVGTLTIATSLTTALSNGVRLRLMRRPAGSATFSKTGGSRQQVPASILTDRRIYRDRFYTFHFLDTSVARGNYEYALALWMTGDVVWTLDGSGVPSASVPTSRVRCRNMTSTWIG